MKKVIAIDGPSGAGKSTVSKCISENLGFKVLDTGALYRATALYLRRCGVDENTDEYHIQRLLMMIKIVSKDDRVILNVNTKEEDVSDLIRTTEIGHYASLFSAKSIIRDFLLDLQRNASLYENIIAEGRDMTTVVFPNAWKKFYLDASIQKRAERRFLQLKQKGIEITIDESLRDVKERDIRDSQRKIAPLKRATDAYYIDSTNLTLDEVIDFMLTKIKNNGG